MKRSPGKPGIAIISPSKSKVLQRGPAHLEPFNGSDTMLSIRESVDEKKVVGPHQAIFTVRVASDSVWTRTITIPLFLEKQQTDGTVGASP